MASPGTQSPESPKRGTYCPRKSTDLRSPCPAVNTLANHGYLNRDGRNIRANDIYAALREYGLSSLLGLAFSYPPFIEQQTNPNAPPPGWWSIITHPFNYVFRKFAMRNPGQTDAKGVACLNLDQLAKHNAVEHDISFSRFDYDQGDNHSPQPELIKGILAASSNGTTITMADFAKLRKERIETQRRDNPKVEYEAFQNQLACGEIALILKVFGNGSEVPVSYVKAFFEEERLPREEGWKKRAWWTVGLLELNSLVGKVKGLIGDFGGKKAPVVAAVH